MILGLLGSLQSQVLQHSGQVPVTVLEPQVQVTELSNSDTRQGDLATTKKVQPQQQHTRQD